MPVYTMKKGDTLWNIAKTHLGSGARWKELLVNGTPATQVDVRKIPVGATITILTPAKAPVPAKVPVRAPAPAPVLGPRDWQMALQEQEAKLRRQEWVVQNREPVQRMFLLWTGRELTPQQLEVMASGVGEGDSLLLQYSRFQRWETYVPPFEAAFGRRPSVREMTTVPVAYSTPEALGTFLDTFAQMKTFGREAEKLLTTYYGRGILTPSQRELVYGQKKLVPMEVLALGARGAVEYYPETPIFGVMAKAPWATDWLRMIERAQQLERYTWAEAGRLRYGLGRMGLEIPALRGV